MDIIKSNFLHINILNIVAITNGITNTSIERYTNKCKTIRPPPGDKLYIFQSHCNVKIKKKNSIKTTFQHLLGQSLLSFKNQLNI